jgi:hypothetical protein
MTTELKRDDLVSIRNELTACIAIIRMEAFRAFNDREITDSDFLRAKNKWAMLEVIELELQGEIMNLDLGFILDTSVDSPKLRIIQSTDRLNSAARNIQNISSFLTTVADVIGTFGDIIKAIQTGGILNIP